MVTDPTRLAPMLEDAIRLSNTGRRGPVVLHVPRDLLSAEVPEISPKELKIARPGPASGDDIEAIAALLAGAQRPVIFAGGWRAPIGWSGLIVRASWVSGPLGRCFLVQAGDSPMRCAA